MNIPRLKLNYKHLLSHMAKREMRKGTINMVKSMCEHMFEHEGEYDSYPDYYEKFIDADGFHKANLKSHHQRSTWRIIWAYDEYGHLPDGTWFNPTEMSNQSITKLNKHFRTFIEKEAIPMMKPDQVARRSVLNLTCILSRFFLYMQEHGATTLHKVTEERITSYFFSESGKQIRGLEIGVILSMLLGRIENPESQRIHDLIPALKKLDKHYTTISDETITQVQKELSKEDSNFSLRDRAIITIALYTGMRGADIVNLTIDNIDWGRDLITIIQSKTQQPLTLPLRATVGNAICDYIVANKELIEKGKTLFRSEKDPTKPMLPAHVGNLISRFFKRTGLLNNGNPRRIRIFRHHLASSLLKQGASIAVIRSILGHTTRKAINAYFDIDVEDTRRCGLDISIFPIKDGIF